MTEVPKPRLQGIWRKLCLRDNLGSVFYWSWYTWQPFPFPLIEATGPPRQNGTFVDYLEVRVLNPSCAAFLTRSKGC
jgi:hypothetical protein